MTNGNDFETLFSPASIGRMTVRNRTVMAPIVTQFATDTGAASSVHVAYLGERAKGGVGLIIAEASYINTEGRAWSCGLGIDRDPVISSHLQVTEAVHRYGGKIAIQLHHGGNKANPTYNGGRLLSASDVADGAFPAPEPMTSDDIADVIESFAGAADRAKRAGYDAVELHGAHGYLLHQFMSPATNHRTDEYGGSIENRARFAREVIQGVRQATGLGYPIIIRMSAEGGYGLEDAVIFAKDFEEAGADAINVSQGGTAPTSIMPPETSPMAVAFGYLAGHAETIKQAVDIPVIVVGEIREPAMAEDILSSGKADFVALARPLLADPHWAAKAGRGDADRILRCISCDTCRLNLSKNAPIRCLINPKLGREQWLDDPEPVSASKKVMVVGGGPAGMEVARVAATRGHQVSLYEAESTLGGGQLALAKAPPYKDRLSWLEDYLANELDRVPVKQHLNTRVDANTVASEAPDVLVVATGAAPLIPAIPGIDGDNVSTAFDVLAGNRIPENERVAILGGRQVGCETAEFLLERGNQVTIVARSPESQLVIEAPATYRNALLLRLRNAGVAFITEHDVTDVRSDGLTLSGPDGAARELAADRVIIARGAVSQRVLAEDVGAAVPEVHIIGDSEDPRTIEEAMYEGTLLGRQI
ncbi:MAG: FAD-dependent oxidoreductase [SAR202 cluster bacterium]|jgi:2,4-dienoyl-CoA reductase-like NADH-dependent reductase (Old Yellow Enzyme family)/thioredoxin reductase|nr:FAD-dependent oxidoreductase [SAR202 cluster bacterium]MDP7105246.1 FAD-dependent oxidoreductase [SAR202 cluster bacterium]MDP7226803.1 FAD-dependent oxidoreductase [SAR202 cluster bacterium]